jgi:hypothetical protein
MYLITCTFHGVLFLCFSLLSVGPPLRRSRLRAPDGRGSFTRPCRARRKIQMAIDQATLAQMIKFGSNGGSMDKVYRCLAYAAKLLGKWREDSSV